VFCSFFSDFSVSIFSFIAASFSACLCLISLLVFACFSCSFWMACFAVEKKRIVKATTDALTTANQHLQEIEKTIETANKALTQAQQSIQQQTTKHKIKPVIYCLINDKVPTFKENLFCKKTKIIEWISARNT
jgi:hypothetical protein